MPKQRIAESRNKIENTAETQRAQRKPNEDKLTIKNYRNNFDVRIKSVFFYLKPLPTLRLCG